MAQTADIQLPAAVEVMDPNVRDKILSRPRAKEWTTWEQPDSTLQEVRRKFGANISDEELILRFYAGDQYVDALQNDGRPREYLDGNQPLVKLIEQLSKRKDSNQIYIKRPGFSVRMEKRAAEAARAVCLRAREPEQASTGTEQRSRRSAVDR